MVMSVIPFLRLELETYWSIVRHGSPGQVAMGGESGAGIM